MGMFDYITCEYPLPLAGFEGRFFQTKDLENKLAHYTITSDGRLTVKRWEYEPMPEDDPARKYTHIRAKAGSEYEVDLPYDGNLHFYDWRVPGQHALGLARFEAEFANGKLIEITTFKPGLEFADG